MLLMKSNDAHQSGSCFFVTNTYKKNPLSHKAGAAQHEVNKGGMVSQLFNSQGLRLEPCLQVSHAG